MPETRFELLVHPRSVRRHVQEIAFRTFVKLRAIRFEALSFLRPGFIRSPYGVTLKANWEDATFRFYALGAYGTFFCDVLRKQTSPFTLLDIGANQGLYSLIAAGNPNCLRVIAFEPVDHIADIMEENLRLNQARNVILVRCAVSDRVQTLQIAFNVNHSGTSTLTTKPADGETGHWVSIQTINHAELSRLVHNDGEPIIVKIDVEGHEPVVIAELLKASFAASIRAIFYECDDRWMSERELRELLADHGFDHFQKVGSGRHYDVYATRLGKATATADRKVGPPSV